MLGFEFLELNVDQGSAGLHDQLARYWHSSIDALLRLGPNRNFRVRDVWA